ncbi:MAG TPA: hypothetical protein PLM15_07075 [Methanothrix soehngenii]|nr:hypothetical protein [Methanothrix soehngenii]
MCVSSGRYEGKAEQALWESPYFALVEMDFMEMKLLCHEIVANPHKDLSKGKGPGYAFAEAGVETVQTDAETLEELGWQIYWRRKGIVQIFKYYIAYKSNCSFPLIDICRQEQNGQNKSMMCSKNQNQ